jgi:ubiquinone/menaquinone biosynthesis C-methylase UbiE
MNCPNKLKKLLDICCGSSRISGYYVVRLSPIVGPGGRIIAEDVVPEYLQALRNRVRDLGLQNVVISLGEPHDPRLPADSLDLAILVHMYHEIEQPFGLLYNLGSKLIIPTPAVSKRARPLFPKTRHANSDAMGQ